MVTVDGKIKCDGCGKFISQDNWKRVFTPDSYYTVEQSEDYDPECFKKYK